MGQSAMRFLQRCKSRILRHRKSLSSNDGSALIELALIMSFFGAPMIVGTSEVAFMVYDSIEATNAAHAGAMYGMISSTFASDSANIISAAKAEAPDLSNMSVTPTVFYACSTAISGTQYSSAAAANSACTGGSNHSLEFIQVVTTVSMNSPFRFAGLPSTLNIGGASVMEVQE